MSKRITTHWYIVAWLIWVLAFIGLFLAIRSPQAAGSPSPPPFFVIAYLVMAVASIVALVMWIGALIRLGQIQAWGWFMAVLIPHVIGLGIVGMVAYAVAGPEDVTDVAIRPRRVA